MPVSTTPPQDEDTPGAMEYYQWKMIGETILVKSNINNWISCTPGTGSLIAWVSGTLDCSMVESITTECPDLPVGKILSFHGGINFRSLNYKYSKFLILKSVTVKQQLFTRYLILRVHEF